MILQSTPVLFVDRIEPSEAFFEKLGFERTVGVPEGDGPEGEGMGFIIMMQGGRSDSGLGVMLQTRASAANDMTQADPTLFDGAKSFLFMSVADVDAAARALEGHEQFLSRRETFYGATEVGFREPGGHHVVLAQFAANSPDEA
jgi:hypothetical protein